MRPLLGNSGLGRVEVASLPELWESTYVIARSSLALSESNDHLLHALRAIRYLPFGYVFWQSVTTRRSLLRSQRVKGLSRSVSYAPVQFLSLRRIRWRSLATVAGAWHHDTSLQQEQAPDES